MNSHRMCWFSIGRILRVKSQNPVQQHGSVGWIVMVKDEFAKNQPQFSVFQFSTPSVAATSPFAFQNTHLEFMVRNPILEQIMVILKGFNLQHRYASKTWTRRFAVNSGDCC